MLLAEPHTTKAEPRVRRKRIRKKQADHNKPSDTTAVGSAACVLVLTALYIVFLCQTERVLNSVETGQHFRFHSFLFQQPPPPQSANTSAKQVLANIGNEAAKVASVERALPSEASKDVKFLIFEGEMAGQGAGNTISGLLSAHLLGLEFGRIVCVHPKYTGFLDVFDAVGEEAVAKCPRILQRSPDKTLESQIQLINFMSPPDECEIQDKLKSDEPVLYLTGNTYPRWPAVPDRFFLQHYRAKKVLLNALPYDPQHPPTTVVHLRSPDDLNTDPRKGLDDASLKALGETLPKGAGTYLVTNRVAFYKQFEDCCQWSHPVWNSVIHIATGQQWGSSDGKEAVVDKTDSRRSTVEVGQNVQLWADWYTILTAQTVYHTHSDFSISAIHWMNNKDSHSIVGFNEASGVLETTAESWWVDGETAPLSQRTLKATGTSQLRLCERKIDPEPRVRHRKKKNVVVPNKKRPTKYPRMNQLKGIQNR